MALLPRTKKPNLLMGGVQPSGPLPLPAMTNSIQPPTFSMRPSVDVKKPFSINPIADNTAGAKELITKVFPHAPLIAEGINTGNWKPYFDAQKQQGQELKVGLSKDATPEQRQKATDYLMSSINPEGGPAKKLVQEVTPEIKAAIQHIPAELMAQADTVAKKILDSGIHAPQEIWDAIRSTFDDVGVKLPKQQSEAADVIQSLTSHYKPPEVPVNTVYHTPHPEYIPPGNAAQMAPQTIETALKDFTKALTEAKPVRAEQEALYSAERSKRQAAYGSQLEKATTKEQFQRSAGALKGELPKAEFTSLEGKITQDHVNALYSAVAQTKKLSNFEKATAGDGLDKMFGSGGVVPTEKEIELLSQVFPPDTMKAILDNRSLLSRIGQNVSDVINLPRTIMSSIDMSAPLRQGLFLIGKPVRFAQAFGGMFKQAFSQKAFDAAQASIHSRPTYPLMEKAGLALTYLGGNLSAREERFMSKIAEKIPGVKASARAYTGFLNKLRADVFDDMLLKMQNTVGVTPDRVEQMASFINAASGRGDLGALGRASEVLNGVFFSPRLMASRVQLLRQVVDPVFIARQDPFVRKEAWKTLLSSASILATITSLLALGGAKVSLDATNADFLKARFGKTRFDLGGGMTQYVRLMAQIGLGKVTSSITGKSTYIGKGYKPLTDQEIIGRFLQNKENPIFSLIAETPALIRGNAKNAIGEPTNIPTELINRVVPLIAQDMYSAVQEVGPVGIFTGVPAAFGVGTQTYAAPSDKAGGLKSRSTTVKTGGLKPRTSVQGKGGLKPRI